MTSLGLLLVSSDLPIPPRGVRASRLADLLRVLQVADYDVWRHPALVAAATAFMHRVSRVVLATSLDALLDLDAIVDLGPFEPAPITPPSDAPPIFTTGPDDTNLAALVTALGLAADTAPVELAAEAPRRLYPTLGKASVLVTQHPRMVPVPPSVLAATLYVSGASTLLPTVEYLAPPHDADTLADLGFVVLRTLGPSRRVARGFGFPSPRRREPDVATAGAELAPSGLLTVDSSTSSGSSGSSGASGASAPLPPELNSLRSALGALCERFSYRLPSDAGGMKILDREAKKLLQSEVVAGHIKGFALAIVPTGDDLQDLGLEVVVTLPRRVGQVILRLTPMPNRTPQ